MYLSYSFLDFVSFSQKENDGTAILDRKKILMKKKTLQKERVSPLQGSSLLTTITFPSLVLNLFLKQFGLQINTEINAFYFNVF